MRLPASVIAAWFPLAVIATATIGSAFLLIHLDLRQTADDPQIQMAEDAAERLSKGRGISEVVAVPDSSLDLSRSQSPFLAVYDEAGKPVSWSMTLDGNAPTPPAGVFTYAKAHGMDRVTWQPSPQVRQALIVVPYSKPDGTSGFAAAGRSLRDTENRVSQAQSIALIAWLATMSAALMACMTARRRQED